MMAARVFQLSGVGWNTMIYLDEWPDSPQGSAPAKGWQQAVGSTGAGKALNMKQLGFDVCLHSLLGRDDAAERISNTLEGAGIECLWQRYDGASEQHINLMSPDGSRRSIFVEQEPDKADIDMSALQQQWLSADYCWLNIKPYCRDLAPILAKLDKPIWCDLHDYDPGNAYHQPFIDAADYLMASGEQIGDVDQFMVDMIEAGKQLVVVTDGGNAIRAMDATGDLYRVEPPTGIEIVDSNGAGDAFSAGLLFGWHQKRPLTECLQLAACAGAISLSSNELANPLMDAEMLMEWYNRYYR